MAAAVTLNEVEKMIDLYVVVESKFQPVTKIEIPELTMVLKEHQSCSNKGTGASTKLKDYARILQHFLIEAAAEKVSQRNQFSQAIKNYLSGMDVPKAIKRSRLAIS